MRLRLLPLIVITLVVVLAGLAVTRLVDERTLLTVGLILVGPLGIWIGGNAVVRRRLDLRDDDAPRTSYRGLGAVLMGMLVAVVGLGMLGAGLALAIGREATLTAFIEENPAALIAVVSLLAILIGSTQVAGSREQSLAASRLSFALSLPGRLFGALMALAGLVALVVSLVAIFAPALYASWEAQLRAQLGL